MLHAVRVILGLQGTLPLLKPDDLRLQAVFAFHHKLGVVSAGYAGEGDADRNRADME